jgi:hypothetical protein
MSSGKQQQDPNLLGSEKERERQVELEKQKKSETFNVGQTEEQRRKDLGEDISRKGQSGQSGQMGQGQSSSQQ